MPSNLVGVRLVCNSTVLRDWALHFGPSGGGTLVDFFADIATGKNDAGDGFVLDPKYDAAKVQARVADQKDGKEMTLPASASFQDATNFGQWFTFQVPLRAGFKSGETKPRPAATAAAHQVLGQTFHPLFLEKEVWKVKRWSDWVCARGLRVWCSSVAARG